MLFLDIHFRCSINLKTIMEAFEANLIAFLPLVAL